MRRKSHKSYLFLFAAILLLMSVPYSSAEKLRGATIAMLAPLWDYLATVQLTLKSIPTESGASSPDTEHLQKLQLENRLLTNEVVRLRELLIQERRLITEIKSIQQSNGKANDLKQLSRKHYRDLKGILKFQLQAVPARVLFRSPSSWGSSLWLNVGQAKNEELGYKVIAKNSPVVVGNSIVGVVDYVGTHQCRVRLITDSGLSPSVRSVRGNPTLLGADNSIEIPEIAYLAKGELHGSSQPLWRSRGILLQGVGFNYDFADAEGPARDLRTGIPVGSSDPNEAIPIVKVNDLLVTTGMDGVFPPGFSVAEVTYVRTLREGDYYYELSAKSTAGNLDELTFVSVIPPVGYDPSDQPPLIGE